MKLPAAGKYLPQLDGVRAIAVLMVVALHCIVAPKNGFAAWVVRNAFSNGWIGVVLFFVLSGYLITSILLREKSEPHYFRNFYARRALRIFPLYYLVAIVLLIASPHLPFGPFPTLPIFTYTVNYAMVLTGREWMPLAHAWSLCVEEQFYLVWPFIVLKLDTRQLRTLLLCVIVLSPPLRMLTNGMLYPKASVFLTHGFLDVLGAGALIAVLFHERSEVSESAVRRMRIALALVVFATAVLWLTKQLDSPKLFQSSIALTFVGSACALFVALATLDALPFGAVLRWPLMRAIGRVSYGIYLIHYVVLQLTLAFVAPRYADTWTRTAVIAVISISASFALAAASWLAYERPMLRLKKFFYERDDERVRLRAEVRA